MAGARRRAPAARMLVNRRTDLALAAGADGVHLGFDGVDVMDARRLLGDAAWVGVSCHAVAEVAGAARAGASYAHLAPIHPPLSKAPERPALGPGVLTAAAATGLPVLAQGGLQTDNAAEAVRAGAVGVAVTGAVLGAREPAAAARALRRALGGPGGTLRP